VIGLILGPDGGGNITRHGWGPACVRRPGAV